MDQSHEMLDNEYIYMWMGGSSSFTHVYNGGIWKVEMMSWFFHREFKKARLGYVLFYSHPINLWTVSSTGMDNALFTFPIYFG